MSRAVNARQHIPDIICDENTRGMFAKYYEIINVANNQSFAGKIVSRMVKEVDKKKITQEIKIHQSLKHKNVVEFYSIFKDRFNIYIVLEFCKNKSMKELKDRRRLISEPETRFYMNQILNGVNYLHQRRIIHRDLRLENLFLNDDLQVKIGGFGMAAKIEFDGERRHTICTTPDPNFVAPEILQEGHSFEVDIWSIGCIMYIMLIGKLPFEAHKLLETYSRIKKCQYLKIPGTVSDSAKEMIESILQEDPKRRPKVHELQSHDFLLRGYCPSSLPVSCLTEAPRFDRSEMSAMQVTRRRPLGDLNNGDVVRNPDERAQASIAVPLAGAKNHYPFDAKKSFKTLKSMLGKVLETKRAKNDLLDEMTDPDAQPLVWVAKWHYSRKFGFGYQLSDQRVGVTFIDTTKLIMLPNAINVHYVDTKGVESCITMKECPRHLKKKMKIFLYFNHCMRDNLTMAAASVVRKVYSVACMPQLHIWCISNNSVLMQLNNGMVQMNFRDHTKIIMCPLMGAITYVDEDKQFRTFRFTTLENNGCNVPLYEKMRYAYNKISVLINLENNYALMK